MGHQFTITGDEAFAAAHELAALTGTSVEQAVISALRRELEKERKHQIELARFLALTAKFTESLGQPLPSSDHSFLYDDETGLPS